MKPEDAPQVRRRDGQVRKITKHKQDKQKLKKFRDQPERFAEESSAELRKANEQLEQEILERRRAEATIKRKLELEQVVFNISSGFVGDFDVDSSINSALREIGKTTGASCCCLFLLKEDGQTIETIHNWCEEGVAPQVEQLKEFSESVFALWRDKLSRRQVIYIRDTSEALVQIEGGKEIFDKIDVKSLLALPVFLGARLEGFIGLCYIGKPGQWTEDDLSLLRISSDLIGRALEHRLIVEALRESEEKYRDLFFSSPGSITVFSPDGTVIDHKSSVTEVSGLPRNKIIGKSLEELANLVTVDIKQLKSIFSRLLAGENLGPLELSVVSQSGQKRWVEIFPSVLKRNGKIYAVQFITEDVTERKQAVEKLKESEQRFRAIFDNAVDGLLLADVTNRTFHGANKMICKMLGYTSEELDNLRVDDIHPKGALPYVLDQFEKQYKGESVVARDCAVKRRDGSVFYADISASVVTIAGKEYLLGIFRDITERREAEESLRAHQERLRSLASELSLTEERERRRIATDLHDHTSQALAVAKIKLAGLQKEAHSENLAAQLADIHKLLEDTIEHLRALTFELSPPVLYQIGFESAVAWLAEQFQKQYGIPCQFEDDRQQKPLEEDIRIILFKAIRELLLNIAKHAKAKKARVSICRDGEVIRVTVTDDGVGFASSAQDLSASATSGFGLFSICERLNHIGGECQIDSAPGRGTRVTLNAPLKRK